MKKLFKQTPEVTHRGLLKKTKNSNVDYRTHISDILGNHYFPSETIHPVELEYGFEHQGDNVFKFTRSFNSVFIRFFIQLLRNSINLFFESKFKISSVIKLISGSK